MNLRRLGHEVAVLTPFPSYPTGVVPNEYRGKRFLSESIDGIPVTRIWHHVVPNRGAARRNLSHLSFALMALPAATRLPWKPDVISVNMHPLFLVLAAKALARIWRIPYVITAGDLVPDQAIAYGAMKSKTAVFIARKLARFGARGAAFIVPLTSGIRDGFIGWGIPSAKLEVIHYGGNVDLYLADGPTDVPPFMQDAIQGKFVVGYVGSHGLPHGLEVAVEAADLLRDQGDIHFVMVGDGSRKESLIEQATTLGLDNISFFDAVPRSDLPAVYENMDICLVTLRRLDWIRIYALASKVFDVMAAARPVIVSAEGETADFVRQADAGVVVEPENARALADAVLRLREDPQLRSRFGRNGRQFILEKMSRQIQTRRYEAILERVVARGSRVPAETDPEDARSLG